MTAEHKEAPTLLDVMIKLYRALPGKYLPYIFVSKGALSEEYFYGREGLLNLVVLNSPRSAGIAEDLFDAVYEIVRRTGFATYIQLVNNFVSGEEAINIVTFYEALLDQNAING
jgi:GNAT superfamily N-acetyltransferase